MSNSGNINTAIVFMEKILKYLEQLDLSEVEAKLYMTLLETGPISVRDLANRIEIKRTTTYLYIDHLMKKGLIIKTTTGSKTQVAATQPETGLEHLVHEKVVKAKHIQEKFPAVLQSIDLAFAKTNIGEEAEIKYYKGKLGVRKIYEDALKSKEVRSYFNNETLIAGIPENEMLFMDAFVKNKELKLFEIIQNTPTSQKLYSEFQVNNPNRDRYLCKILPEDVKLSATDILIFEGNVAIINVRNQISGILLQNVDYYNNSKEIFDLIWKGLPDIES
ncbi:MAG TPA: helix-turn-helix domain-containing protein [Candidatus Saccharimonadales bacterium]|nr:helix-turn-helix domain-containing protein [Candidatus Saccharimonadales bacterium]